jgi:ParB-like chromosome segregation protein Spo0J
MDVATPIQIQELGLDDIHVAPDRIRALRPESVSEIAESIQARGLINPITVTEESNWYLMSA